MEIDYESVDRLLDWLTDERNGAEPVDRERVKAFLRSVQDGTWMNRWASKTDLATPLGSERHIVWLRDWLALVVDLDYEGQPNVLHVSAILVDQPWPSEDVQ